MGVLEQMYRQRMVEGLWLIGLAVAFGVFTGLGTWNAWLGLAAFCGAMFVAIRFNKQTA